MANIFDRVLEEPKNDLSKNIFDRVSSKLKQKGGDKNAYQTSESSDRSSKNRNEQGVQASPIEASSSEGIQPNEQPGSQDQQIVQRGQQANLTGDSSFINGGETIEGQKEISQGDEATKEGQRVRVKSPAGNKEEVMAGGVQPPKSNIFDRLAGQEKEKRVSPGFTEEMSTSQGREAFVATALETGIPMALGSVAATFAGTAAAAASVPFAGPAAPLVGIGAGAATFLATQELASKILVKPIEGFLGLKEGVESAQAASPESTKYGGYAGMLPFLAESGAGFVKTGVEAAAKALQGQAAQAVTKAVAKKAAAGFAGGVAFEPARYAFEATEKGLGITDEAPKDITGGSLLESGVMGLVLGGKVEEAKTEAGKKVIRDAGLPESAEMAAQLKTDAHIEKDELLKKTPVQYKSPDRLTKDADGKLRELIAKKENRTISEKELEEHDFLQTYPTPDELASYYGVKVSKEQGPSLSAFIT